MSEQGFSLSPEHDLQSRLSVLAHYDILDTPGERGFDDLAALAAQLCDAPTALISLVDHNRQWFKARVGFEPSETPLSDSVCFHALKERELLVIPDLTLDDRTRDNSLVRQSPFLRFYAGAVLRNPDGIPFGTLCVLDTKPRAEGLTGPQSANLQMLAGQVMSQFELRLALRERDSALQSQERAEAALRQDVARYEALIAMEHVIVTAAGDLGAILAAVVDGALHAVPACEGAAIEMREGDELVYRAVSGNLAAYQGFRLAIDSSLSGACIREGRPLYCEDTEIDGRVDIEAARKVGSRAMVLTPVMRQGEFVGALKLQSSKPNAFSERDRLTAQLIAGAMAAGFVTVDEAKAMQALRENEELLRLAQEAAEIGTFDTDVRTNETRGSEQFFRLFGLRAPGLVLPIADIEKLVRPEDRHKTTSETRRRSGLDATHVEYRISRADTGEERWISRHATYVMDRRGRPLRLIGTAQDVTGSKRAEVRQTALLALGDRMRDLTQAAEIAFIAAEALGETLGGSRAGYGAVNAHRNMVDIGRDWRIDRLASLSGQHDLSTYGIHIDDLKQGERVVVTDTITDERTGPAGAVLAAIEIRALIALPVMEHDRLVAIFFLTKDQPHAWSNEEIVFVRNVADRARAAIARIEAEDRQRLLNEELGHRLKNTLAMVQAIATQTMRNAPSVQHAREALAARLLALSRAHEVLLHKSVEPTDIRRLILGAISLLAGDQPNRIRLSGPWVEIGSRAGLSMALMLHELATNATKYGALSVNEGFVSIDWSVAGERDEARLELVWQEHDGPPVAPPPRKGFGSRLIERGLAGSVEGSLTLAYEPNGVRCHLTAPLVDVRSQT